MPVIIRAPFGGFDVGGGDTMVVDMVFVLVLVDKVHTTNMEMVTIDRIIASIADSDIIADVDILVSHINIEGVVAIRLVRAQVYEGALEVATFVG